MVDVVIIGGGPSGVSAGTVLQRKGYKTCIIDTQIFPREKLCAGVLTLKSIKLIQHIYKDINLNDMDKRDIYKIELLYDNRIIGKYIVDKAYRVINRTEFDNELLKYYKSVGGMVFDGQENYKIAYDKRVVVLSNGQEIPYRILIGADGINSKVRAYVGRSWNAAVLCFEKFIPNLSDEDTIKIDFAGILGGYSWRIPGKNKVSVGLGEFYIRGMKKKPDRYRRYFESQGIKEMNSIKGAFVSFGNFVRKPVKNNVLLVGDAAGLVDAMTGEGIYFAIESGRQASLAIIDYFEGGGQLTAYVGRIKKIHKKMQEQSIYNKILYVPILQLISLGYIRKNPKFVHNILNNVVSTYHSGYTKEIWRKKIQNDLRCHII